MKKVIYPLITFTLLLVMSISFGFAQGTHKSISLGTSGAPYGFYEYLPQNYQQNGEKFPLLIFLHGAGEKGNGKNQLHEAVRHGPGREIENGKHLPFVVLSPQTAGWWDMQKLDGLIEHAIEEYNIDRDRIYLTGLSMGAMSIYQYAARHSDKIAGIVAIAGSGRTEDVCNYSDVPLWAFHGNSDGVVPVTGSMNIVNTYNNCNSKPFGDAKLTIIEGGGHSGWDDIYNKSRGDIYSWLLQYSKNGEVQPEPAPAPAPAPNLAPVADAGSDKVVELPLEELIMSGSATDPDSRISSYSWAKLSGPHVNIVDGNSANLLLKDLHVGTYRFKFTATDTEGAAGSDEVHLKVKQAPGGNGGNNDDDGNDNEEDKNSSVIADAGSDVSIKLPENTHTLHGSAKWENCAVLSYNWEKVSGPAVQMSGGGANLFLENLQEGEYTFHFTAVSTTGVSDSDEVKLKVRRGAQEADEGGAPAPEVGAGQGLAYSYYEIDPRRPWNKLPQLKNMQAVKTGHVDGFSVSPREQDDYFAFAYDGYIKISNSGRYAFYTYTDEGSKLYIDDELVVDNDGRHNAEVEYGWIHLTSGQHKIRVEYFENTGQERLYVSYKGPGVELQEMPKNILSTTPAAVPASQEEAENGLSYAYFENNNTEEPWFSLPGFNRLSAKKSGTISQFSLSEKEQDAHYAFLFEGRIKIENAGEYTFYTYSDDGSQLFIDGQLVVDNDGWHGPQERAGKVQLSPGFHDIRVSFYEQEIKDMLEVSWRGPQISKETIPSEVLYKKEGALRNHTGQALADKEDRESLKADFEKPAVVGLYPNPAQSELNLDLGEMEELVTVSISDLTGRNFYQKSFSTTANKALRLDLDAIGLTKGAYVMVIKNQRQEMIKAIRFLKE